MEEGMKKGATWPCSVVEVWELREGRGHVGKSTGKLPERKRAAKGWAEGAERGMGMGGASCVLSLSHRQAVGLVVEPRGSGVRQTHIPVSASLHTLCVILI